MAQPAPDGQNRVEMSAELRATLHRAVGYARQQAHRTITIEHVLLALNEDPDAALMLEACGIEQARLHADISSYLGHNEDRFNRDEAVEPVMDPEAARIINSAVAASQKSRRSVVNGAIILAAIIGDGRSVAANTLRAQGLTFEAAIQALQQGASARPSDGPRVDPPPSPVDERPSGQPDPHPDHAELPDEPEPQPYSHDHDSNPVASESGRYPEDDRPGRDVSGEDDPLAAARARVNAARQGQAVRRGKPSSSDEAPPSSPPERRPNPARRLQDRLRDGTAQLPPEVREEAPEPEHAKRDPRPSGRDAPAGEDARARDAGASDEEMRPRPHASRVPPSPPPSGRRAGPRGAADPSPQPQSRPQGQRQPRPAGPPPDHPSQMAAPVRQRPAPSGPPGGAPRGDRLGPDRPYPGESHAPGGGGSAISRPPPPRRDGREARPPGDGPPSGPPHASRHRQIDPAGRGPSHPGSLPSGPPAQHDSGQPGRAGGPPSSGRDHPTGRGDGSTGYPGARPVSARPSAADAEAVHPSGEVSSLGQLHENIPRRMRAWVPVKVEVRVARAEIANVNVGMQDEGRVNRHAINVTKAMCVRLRAPDGGFFIESAAPETQWIENQLGVLNDDFASWRWIVTPRRGGAGRLQLIVSARTVGPDGLAAETALPDQVIDVSVSVNYARLMRKWGGWILAAVVGGLLAKFGELLWASGLLMMG